MTLKLLPAVAVCILITACTIEPYRFYGGPVRPQAEIAVLRGDGRVHITHVDGAAVDRGRPLDVGSRALEILPGQHSLTVLLVVGSGMAAEETLAWSQSVPIVAKAGHAYWLSAEINGDAQTWTWTPTITEKP